jgi:hypothetical protein
VPPIIGPASSSSATGATRKTIRRRLADELGMYGAYAVSSTPSASVTPDAARQVLVTSIGSDGVPEDYLNGSYVYAVDGTQAGETRKVLSGTFDGPIGSLLLDRPFSAALASGTEVEITSPLPVGRWLNLKGLHEAINEALARIWVAARLTMTGNGTYSYSLDAYPWITDPDQIRLLQDSYYYGSSRPADRSPYSVRMVVNGASRTLVVDAIYSSADTFYLDVFVRGDRYVSDGTTWAYQTTPGLQSDLYQCAAPEEQVVAFAMTKCLQAERRLIISNKTIDKTERSEMLRENGRRTLTWARAAARIKREQFPKPIAEAQRGLVASADFVRWP